MSAVLDSPTELGDLCKRVAGLERRIRKTDDCLGQVAAQAARVDNRFTVENLREIREAFELWHARFDEIYTEHKRMLDDLAAIRGRLRREADAEAES